MVRTVNCGCEGLGYSLPDYWALTKNLFDPWSYQPSVPQPGIPVATNRAEVYGALNTLIGVISSGLERARGNATLTAQGNALSQELARFYQTAGQNFEWARTNISGFAQRVYQWSAAVGQAGAGGAQAFEQAQRGASPGYQAGRLLGEAASSDFGKWLLPLGAGLLLLILLRR